MPTKAAMLRDPLLIGGVGLATLTLLRFHDPHDSGSYGYCPFLMLTGHPCPGCGGLRAMNDLMHGDVVGAVSSNAMAVLLLGALVVAWVIWMGRRWRGEQGPLPGLTAANGIGLVAAFVAFAVVRNTPWGAWLAP